MFECFNKPGKTVVSFPESPIETVGPEKNVPIALVVGHNKESQGAVNYLQETEYVFNKRIANKIQGKLSSNGVKSIIIERPKGSYSHQCDWVAKNCKRREVTFSLHLHFNSATVEARGCEALIASSASKLDDWYASYITQEIHDNIKIASRHGDGIKTVYKGHRGYEMLEKVRQAGTVPVLIEPCFAHYPNPDSRAIFENEDHYVNVLTQCLYMIARGEVKRD